MSARILLDRTIHVSHSTAQAGPGDDPGSEPDAFWRGQVNGLCGAAVRGFLCLVTGLHTGYVRFTAELHPAEPPLGDGWEEAVEVSFRHRAKKLWLGGLMSDAHPVKLPAGDYRVRYCARGMAQGHRLDVASEDEVVDAYLLQFWPGQTGPDRIVRQTTEIAAYRHQANPKPALTDADHAERKRRRAEAKARRKIEDRRAEDRLRWGDRIPNDRLRKAARQANPADLLDADAVFTLAELDDEACGAVARWAAGRAVAVAGLEQVPWVVQALAALDRGEPLPPPFRPQSGADPADPAQVWELLNDAGLPLTTVILPAVASDGRMLEISRQHVALPAVFATAARPALAAAMNALWAAGGAHGEDGYRQFFAELRSAFPQLVR
ncbi:hypothetical protein DMB66_36600 [Actinoplanes sp. ATCC 53533]|uniref:hypothetical protein n=1 Tax=Actinoplanes sp. ATCC 53533 TaxID=1288362 RepID=UPI000F7869C6|nr:hypothetical protein [Actinoplanes sp. ATCC 53533]RSM54880.1 hypothetical protein DMB66_36600 [Actinoplanes sp. ATCC 53533]